MTGAVVIETPLTSTDVTAAAAAEDAPSARVREDDWRAIEECRNGDTEAFGRLVERYQRDVYRLCYRYVNNHEDANDLSQEAFVKAYRALARFRGDSSFTTWLYRIAVNTCLNFRSARRIQAGELPEDLRDHGPGPWEGLDRAEQADWVRQAVERLPAKQRATLILKVYQDLSHEEVAHILGSTVGTAKANLFHALANLRKLLGAEREGGA